MADEWVETTLGDVADFLSGGTPSKSRADYWDGSIPWVSAKDMKRFRLDGTEDHVTEAGARHGTRVVPAGTVLLLTRGMTLLSDIPICVVGQAMAFNQDVKALRPKPCASNEFLPYLLLGHKARLLSSVDLAGHGTGRLNSNELKALDVLLPSVFEQRAIAHILGTLDDRIELSRQMNATLESIAQAIFKSWFVDFDPVRAKAEGREPEAMDAETAVLFPSEFEESELGPIPKGWRVEYFGDIARLSKDTIAPGRSPDVEFEHYSLPAFDAGHVPVRDMGRTIKSNKTLVRSGSVLISKLNPHIPRVWYVGPVGEHAICSTEFLVWVPAEGVSAPFLYSLARSPGFASSLCQLVTGTSNSHQRVKPAHMSALQVVHAPEAIMRAFTQTVAPMLDQVLANQARATLLADLRDTLLPRLISGRLRVPEAEELLATTPDQP